MLIGKNLMGWMMCEKVVELNVVGLGHFHFKVETVTVIY
jgi:hypothetical protein